MYPRRGADTPCGGYNPDECRTRRELAPPPNACRVPDSARRRLRAPRRHPGVRHHAGHGTRPRAAAYRPSRGLQPVQVLRRLPHRLFRLRLYVLGDRLLLQHAHVLSGHAPHLPRRPTTGRRAAQEGLPHQAVLRLARRRAHHLHRLRVGVRQDRGGPDPFHRRGPGLRLRPGPIRPHHERLHEQQHPQEPVVQHLGPFVERRSRATHVVGDERRRSGARRSRCTARRSTVLLATPCSSETRARIPRRSPSCRRRPRSCPARSTA